MIRRTVVDEFVGIILAIRSAEIPLRPRLRPRAKWARIAKPHKFPLRRTASEEQNGEKRKEALVHEGVFHFILEPMDSENGRVSR